MRSTLRPQGPVSPAVAVLAAALLSCILASSADAAPPSGGALPEGTELWGGPGARGSGAFGADFFTSVYVSTREATTGTVEFWLGGRVVAAAPISTGAGPRWTAVNAPPEVKEKGPFLWHVLADRPVSAWERAYTASEAGSYGTSLPGFLPSDFLLSGDEAAGAPFQASASTYPGEGRSNLGVLCSPLSSDPCRMEVTAFLDGSSVGSGELTAAAGSATQDSLRNLIPATASGGAYNVRFRILAGTGMPYGIRNDNQTNDATAYPLTVTRGAFSTAPRVDVFTASPLSGCSPLKTTYVWSTTNAVRVALSGLGTTFPPAGSTSATLSASTDVVLTAYSASGASTNQPLRVTVLPPTAAPTPSPAEGATIPGGTIPGILPAGIGNVTAEFTQHGSTGSTFVVAGNVFTYTAGVTAGTDVVTLTSQGACGPATATFTATVAPAGPPVIHYFVTDPPRACTATEFWLNLSWSVSGVSDVQVTGSRTAQPASGWYPVKFPAGTLAPLNLTLNAPYENPTVTRTITVPVDSQAVYPSVTPSFVSGMPGDMVSATVSLLPADADVAQIRYEILQNQTGGSALSFWYPTFIWNVGHNRGGGIDVIGFRYSNGCGTFFSNLTILSVPPTTP